MPDLDPNETTAAMKKIEWGVIASLLLSALTFAFSAGVVYTKVLANEREITLLRDSDRIQVDSLARIETKLDIALDRTTEKPRGEVRP